MALFVRDRLQDEKARTWYQYCCVNVLEEKHGRSEMQAFRSILCPVDFSNCSKRALRYAVALTQDFQAKLVVVHAGPDVLCPVSYVDTIPAGDAVLVGETTRQVERFLSEFVPVEMNSALRVEVGLPAESILKVVQQETADLIVMGWSRKDFIWKA